MTSIGLDYSGRERRSAVGGRPSAGRRAPVSSVRRRAVTVVLLGIQIAGCAPDDATPGAAAGTPVSATANVDPARLAAHVQVLASDDFGGRGVATEGETLTIDYIADAFHAAGVQPLFGESYFQPVPLVESVVGPDAILEIAGAGETLRLEYPADVVAWTKRLQPEARLDRSGLVFAGYGIVAPEYGWDDYAGLDVRGQTVVVLVNDPGFATGDPALFRGRAMTYYGRWTYKFEEAARQGARGVLLIHQSAPAAYPWGVVVNSWTGPQFDLRRSDGNAGRVEVEAWISESAARRLLELAGQDLDALSAAAGRRGFAPVPLALEATMTLENALREVVSNNVAGWLPGTERPAETILFSAHWDHLGTDEELVGDRIYNGAADNATGIAALIEQARIAAAWPRPARSLVFAAFTAEERGLLGSLHFAEASPVPLATMVAVLNMDRMNYLGRARDVQVRGYGASELDRYLVEAAAAQDRVVVPEPFPERGLYFRSDHFSLARFGVPGLHVRSGIDYRERGRAWGAARENEYFHRYYHKPGDEYRPDWDLRGAAEDAWLYLEIARTLAGQRAFPEWSQDSEFRAVRARSAAARDGGS